MAQLNLTFLNKVLSSNEAFLGLTVFLLATSGFIFLKYVDSSKSVLLKKLFSIPARKSTTNAIQLGGLPLSFAIMFGVTFCLLSDKMDDSFSAVDRTLMFYWLFSSAVIVLYGHLDDKYELRPVAKLIMQVLSVCSFALATSHIVLPELSAVAFIVLSFWAMGVVNGSNLLDGLDTLTIKLQSVTFGVLLFLSYQYTITSVFILSLIALSGLFAFYYFNKEPAQIHLGEIGGSFLGFTALLCSVLLFKGLALQAHRPFHHFCLSALCLSLPMIELTISFSRRIYNRKSPFSGDKFHLHHILRNYYNLSPSSSSSVFALGYFACMALGLGTLIYFQESRGSVFAFVATHLLLGTSYVAVGSKHWQGRNTLNLKPAALFDYLRKKDIAVITSQDCDDFKIEIISHGEIHSEMSDEHDDDDIAA